MDEYGKNNNGYGFNTNTGNSTETTGFSTANSGTTEQTGYSANVNGTTQQTTYTSGTNYGYTPNPNQQTVWTVPTVPQTKVEKKKSGFMGKLLGGVAIGLAFGICAALGFYAMDNITGGIFNKTTETTVTAPVATNSNDFESQIDSLKKQIAALESENGTATVATTNTGTATTVTTDVTDVVDKVMPSMVSITNLYEETTSYFGRTYKSEAQASGSGIIIGENDSEYLIVTNHHVIADTVQLTVQFTDGTEAAAYVKGYEESMDIAVISVAKSDLSAETINAISVAEVGDSDALKIGEPAIAIGNALGYGQSVTTGVISALNRNIEMENTYDALIQTSAAINPGNSGGALLNIAGQVIGINSNKIGGSTVEGMGYAIPINAVKDIIGDLSTRETKYKVEEDQRGYLGISGATVDSSTAQIYGFPEGVYVTKVYERSAAEAAGIVQGDIIVRVDGQSVTEITGLQSLLEYYKGGDTISVVIKRAGNQGYEEIELQVTLSSKSVFDTENQ